MSLTSFLKTPGVAAQFNTFFPFREQRFSWPTLAPRVSSNPQLIGTAFDYVVRFHLQKWSAPRKFQVEWVAAIGLGMLESSSDYNSAKQCYQVAQERFQRFQEDALCDDDLLASCVHLARLDEVFRERKHGSTPSFKGEVALADLDDLRGCSALLSPARFRWVEALQSEFPPLLNPTFGLASMLVGGADADFCASHTLFEIKTVKEAVITPFMHFQLLGYCALHELGGLDDVVATSRDLDEIAIYFSRFGKIARFPARETIKSQRFEEFLQWFASCAARQFGSSSLLPQFSRLEQLKLP